MAENKLDAKTRKIVQANRPDVGKEGAAYQSAEKQLLAISAEQQRNLELAKLSAKSDAQRNDILQQAATVAMEESTAASGGMEAVTQQVNPATQAVLGKYGMGQPKFRKSQTTSQQVTKQNIIINNNTTNQTTNNVQVPSNIGGPLQGRPLQIKPGSPSEGGGKIKLWLNQTFAKQREESIKRDRDYEKREISLTKSANKMMRKLEDIGRTMSERLDPRRIGTTVSSQIKALLLLLGLQFLASNWTKVLGYVNKIQEGFTEFADWLGFGKNRKANESSGFVKAIKKFLTGNKDDKRDFSKIFRDIFWNPGTEDPKKKGLLNIFMQFFQDLWDDRAEAVRQVLNMPDEGWFDSDALKKLGLDKAFQGTLSKLGDIFTAIVSGTRGLNKILSKNLRNNASDKITNIGDSREDRRQARDNYFFSAGDKSYKKTAYYDSSNKTYIGDVAVSEKIKKPFSFDFDSNGNLVSSSAAARVGNAIVAALKDNKETRTDEVVLGFQKIEDYLRKHATDQERTKYIIWGPDKINAIEEYFGLKNDPEWKKIKQETWDKGKYKYIKRKLTDREKEYIEDSNNQAGWFEDGTEIAGKEYIYERVPVDDKRSGIKKDDGNLIVGQAYGIDLEHLNKIRHLIQKHSSYKGEKEGDELTFDLSDKNSVAAIEEILYEKKQEKGTAENRRAMAAAGGNPNSPYIKKGEVKRTMGNSLELQEKYAEMAKKAEYAEERFVENVGNSYAMDTVQGAAETVDDITETVSNTTGLNIKTDLGEKVQEKRDQMTSQTVESNQWENPNNSGNGLIAFIGDSYVVGMAPFLLAYVRNYGGKAQEYCKNGGSINDAINFTRRALNDNVSTIVYYIGTNNAGSNDSTLRKGYENLINIAVTGQAKIYFSTLIYGQPRIQSNGKTLGDNIKRLNSVLINVCKTRNVSTLDLSKTSGKYKTWDKEGIHPGRGPQDYRIMAKDLVDLMRGVGVSMIPVSETTMKSGQSAVGKTGSASGGMEDAITYAMDYFIKQGFSPEAAAGLVGNFMHESGLSTNIKNKYSGAYGIAQWLGDRKGELFNRYGNNPTLKDELDYVMHELKTTHTSAVKHLNNSSNPTEAATSAFGYYEFSAGPAKAIDAMNNHKEGNMEGQKSLNLRIANANDAYAIYNKRKNNVVDMSSMKGAPGGSYSPGTYEIGEHIDSESSIGGIGGTVSNFFGGGFFGNLIGELANMATRIWDYIVPKAQEVGEIVEEKVGVVGDKISNAINSDITPEVYTGKITPELKDYEAYKKNSGDLPTGLSEVEWKEAVHNKTGDYPIDLGPVNSKILDTKTEAETNPIEEYQKEKSEETNFIGKYDLASSSFKPLEDFFSGNYKALTNKNPEERIADGIDKLVEYAEVGNSQLKKNGEYTKLNAEVTGQVATEVAQNTQVTVAVGSRSKSKEKVLRSNSSQEKFIPLSVVNFVSTI